MIDVSRMVRTIRLKLRDTGKLKVSDMEIVDAINITLEAVYAAAMRVGARAIQREAVVNLADSVGPLPLDFGSVVDVFSGDSPGAKTRLFPSSGEIGQPGRYEVVGHTIRASGNKVFLRYCSSPRMLDGIEGTIPLPFFMAPHIWGLALATLSGEDNIAVSVEKAAGALASSAIDNIAETAGHV